MIKMNNSWFVGPESMRIQSGTKTHVKRAKSGKVWGVRKVGRDTVTLVFGTNKEKEIKNILNWLYQNSAKGWKNDADKFLLYVERQEPRVAETSEGLQNGFKGYVRFIDSKMSTQISGRWSTATTLTFEVISYEGF